MSNTESIPSAPQSMHQALNLKKFQKDIEPVYKEAPKSLIITGNIYDLVTSGLGKDLQVSLFKKFENYQEAEKRVPLKTVKTSTEGNYYIKLYESELIGLTIPETEEGLELELYVFKGSTQLDLENRAIINVKSFNTPISKHIYAYTKPVVKGKLLRNNKVPASGCLVELYSAGEDSSIGSDFTDENGVYRIPYDLKMKNTALNVQHFMYLKYYNNEDIIENVTEDDFSEEPLKGVNLEVDVAYEGPMDIDTNNEDSGKKIKVKVSYDSIFETGKVINDTFDFEHPETFELNDVIIKTNEEGDKYYFMISEIGEELNPKLIYYKDIRPVGEANSDGIKVSNHDYWRVEEQDDGKTYRTLEKRVEFDPSGKSRNVYTKKKTLESNQHLKMVKSNIADRKILWPASISTLSLPVLQPKPLKFTKSGLSESYNYVKETELYRASSSPSFIPDNRVKNMNFSFTRDSLDLYTRLTTRMAEMDIEKLRKEAKTV